jgi:hypothetical protein
VSPLWGAVAVVGLSSWLGCSDQTSAPSGGGTDAGGTSGATSGASGKSGALGAGGARAMHAAGEGGVEEGPNSDAGAAGDGLTHCNSDTECSDDLRCNGEESCVDGACRAGTPSACSNEAKCVEDARLAPCAYPDASPWLAYVADEDTPGLEELYAVKESLIGVQQPIKLNAPLPVSPGKTPRLYSPAWTNDGRWLVYGVVLDEQWSALRF